MTYKADYPFRMDFKQSTISDYNYYGAEMAASSAYKSTFVAFADLAQGWKSTTTVAWAVAKQTGVQFSYKNTHAKAAGSTTNSIEVAKFMLADECPTVAPTLLGDAEVDETLNEGDTLKLDVATIFEDKDGDATVTATILSGKSNIAIANAADSYALDGVVNVVPAANTNGTAILVLEAADAKDTVTYTVTITVVDLENAPVAVNDSYSVNEDETLNVKVTAGILMNDYDIDNASENLTIALVDSTAHGELTLAKDDSDKYTGAFTYVPEENFNGTDSFTYTVTDETGLTSAVGKVSITVKPVNDPLTLVIVDEDFFKDTIQLDEDFDVSVLDPIAITSSILKFEDADGVSTLTIGARSSNGIVNVKETTLGGTYYLDLTPVENANGLDSIVFFAKDSEDSVGVVIYVNVAPVADLPLAVADAYNVFQDSVNAVAAKNGVLANDYNPDDTTVALIAVLDEDATEGKVVLDEDGSFTYTVGEYTGEDYFSYYVVSATGDTSDIVVVTLTVLGRNHAPEVVDGVADTVGNKLAALKEDFATVRYTAAEVRSWFTDDSTAVSKLTYTAESKDSLVTPTFTTAGVLQVAAVKNACGEDTVVVTAADARGLTVSLEIPASISCVNDRPSATHYADTLYVDLSGWEKRISMDSLFYDVDGDSLTYKVVDISNALAATFEDGYMVVTPATDSTVLENAGYRVKVRAYDETDSSTLVSFMVYAVDSTQGIKTLAAAPKATWQNAIAADRGTVSLMDMQGRVMWTRKLPVSESEVRAAAANVQGRKILRVNSQVWTIK